MTAPSLAGLAPARMGTTVVATEGLMVSPDIATQAFQHSGNEYPSVMQVLGAAPRSRFSTPFAEAYAAFGNSLKPKEFTAWDIYFATFAAGLRGSTAVHVKIALTASCKVFAFIKSISCRNRGGPCMAEVEAVYLSNTGLAHPWTRTDNNALPALLAQPVPLTMGPASIDGAVYAGEMDFSIDFGHEVLVGVDGSPGDGLLYPTVAQFIGGKPVFTAAHGDPMSILTELGFTGEAIDADSFIQYMRTVDASSQLVGSTGYSLTMAKGRVVPVDFGADTMRAARGGFRVEPLSIDDTYPIIVASGAAVPTP
jgi:hypothetical protein